MNSWHKLVKIFDKVTPGAARSLGWEIMVTFLTFPASIVINRKLGATDRGLLAIVLLLPNTLFTIGSCQWDRIVTGLITSRQITPMTAWNQTLYYTYRLTLLFLPIVILANLIFYHLPQYSHLPRACIIWSALFSCVFPLSFLSGSTSSIFLASGNVDGQYLMRSASQCSYLLMVLLLLLVHQISVPSLIIVNAMIQVSSVSIAFYKKNALIAADKSLLTIESTNTVVTVNQQKPSFKPLIQGFFPYLLESVGLNIDIWAFSLFSTPLLLGNYVAVKAIMLPVGLLSNAFISGSTAKLDWQQSKQVTNYLIKTLVVMLLISLPIMVGGYWLGPILLVKVLGKSFNDGGWMIPWITLIVVIQAVAIQFHFALQLSGDQSAYLRVQAIEPIAKLIVIIVLARWQAEKGIFFALILLAVIKIIVCYWYQQRFAFRVAPLQIS